MSAKSNTQKPAGAPITVTNCVFNGGQIPAESIDIAKRLAEAAAKNAEAICKVADMLKPAPSLVINQARS